MKSFLWFSLLLPNLIYAQIPIELFYGSDYGVMDIRISRAFNDSSRFSLFSKNIFEIEYEGKSTFDVLQNLNFNLTEHVGLVSSVRLADDVVGWRNGIRLVHEAKHIFFTAQLLYDWNTISDRIAYLMIVRFTHPILLEKVYLHGQTDFLGGFYAADLSYANTTSRLRLGLGKGKTQYGFAMNQEWVRAINQDVGNSDHYLPIERKSNYGVFIRYLF